MIGRDWSGTLTHDGYSTYNRFGEAVHQQCVDHALRGARKLAETQTGPAKRFPLQVIDLFGASLGTRTRLAERGADVDDRGPVYDDYVERLRHLTARPRQDAANETFARHLNAHASSWFAFLLDPATPATNHRGEQALRVPIVNRKVWGGNRTEAGAEAQEVTSSVLATCHKRNVNPFTFVSRALRGLLGSLFGSAERVNKYVKCHRPRPTAPTEANAMSEETSIRAINEGIARQINREARADPNSPYAHKFVGIANGKVVGVADTCARSISHSSRSSPTRPGAMRWMPAPTMTASRSSGESPTHAARPVAADPDTFGLE